jgi:hypothetical protein
MSTLPSRDLIPEPTPKPGVLSRWLEQIDPGTHRRIKGLRLVTAYGIAAMLGSLHQINHNLAHNFSVGTLAGGFALWASVSEARSTRSQSSRDLTLLCAAAAIGSISMILLGPPCAAIPHLGPELVLALGAFLVGYLRRFGITGAGIGSQIYIGQLLAFSLQLNRGDIHTVLIAGLLAIIAAVVPRLLSGPAEHPILAPSPPPLEPGRLSPQLAMGLQAATAAVAIVILNSIFHLQQSAWAITAVTYVISGSATSTADRVRRRIIGTLIGVPLGIACLPLATRQPLLLWALAAAAMVIYAMALPNRYDIACAAFAFTLMVTLAVDGVQSPRVLSARIWETILGAALGLAASTLILPLRPRTSTPTR